jgi:hypothetical protein
MFFSKICGRGSVLAYVVSSIMDYVIPLVSNFVAGKFLKINSLEIFYFNQNR